MTMTMTMTMTQVVGPLGVFFLTNALHMDVLCILQHYRFNVFSYQTMQPARLVIITVSLIWDG